jgi:hypothetical protein
METVHASQNPADLLGFSLHGNSLSKPQSSRANGKQLGWKLSKTPCNKSFLCVSVVSCVL